MPTETKPVSTVQARKVDPEVADEMRAYTKLVTDLDMSTLIERLWKLRTRLVRERNWETLDALGLPRTKLDPR